MKMINQRNESRQANMMTISGVHTVIDFLYLFVFNYLWTFCNFSNVRYIIDFGL